MSNVYLFVPPQREVEILDELRRRDQYRKTFRPFIQHCIRDYADTGYRVVKLLLDVFKLIDRTQPEELRIGAAGRLLQRIGPFPFVSPSRRSILAPSVAAQAAMHQQPREEEMWQRSLSALFAVLHEHSTLLLKPPTTDFYGSLLTRLTKELTTDMLGKGWSRRFKRHQEVIVDPIALQEIKAEVEVEDLPALAEVFAMLPERKLELMTLFYVNQLSVQQIADRCHLSTVSVRSHLSQARKILRQHYS